MSLGKPDLYIGDQLMQTAKGDPRPALAGLRLSWGNDSLIEPDPAAKLSGQLLIKGAMPGFLEVGAPVGLIDPITSRCLFAGNLAPLTADPDERVQDALRVSFTAASPKQELEKHSVLDFDWPLNEHPVSRFSRLASSMPRGWTLNGSNGAEYDWIPAGRQKFQNRPWLDLAEWYCNSYRYRYHDTSYYTPGAGLTKRMTFTRGRDKTIPAGAPGPGPGGVWHTGTGKPAAATGLAVLPEAAVRRDGQWIKSPEDTITDVKVSSWGGALAGTTDPDKESYEFEYWMDVYVNNTALQDAYGFRQVKVPTSFSASNTGAVTENIKLIVAFWLDTATGWRPTGLQLPDSRRLSTDALVNLLATNTRHMSAVSVPTAAQLPGLIRAYVTAGDATWTGKKWITDLTLGRTL